MTHLRIELNTITENVTSDVIHKLYETAKAIIDAEEANDVQESLVSLKGNLLVSKAYGDEVLWLIDKFGPELSINITLGSYIRFADDAIADRMIALYSGDGIGVTNADLSGVTTLNYAFVGNKETQIQTFNELGSIHSITSLGTFCFNNCSNLRSIDLSNILYLGGEALLGCVSLSGIINLPNLILVGDSVRGSTFAGCTGITLINFGQSFSTMNEAHTFMGCTGLTTITGFDNITTIPYNTFKNCTSLANIDLSNVTSIGGNAFLNCTSLTSVDLSSCTTIDTSGFNGCISLLSVDLSNIVSIGDGTFYNCTALTNIGTSLSNCTSIGWNGFANCKSLTSITLNPTQPVALSGETFSWCENLTTINNSHNISVINEYTFNRCYKLTSLDLSGLDFTNSNVLNAFHGDPFSERSLFYRCEKLTTLGITSIPITKLGMRTFVGCASLQGELSFPNLTTNTGGDVGNSRLFQYCSSLTKISLGHIDKIHSGSNDYNNDNAMFYRCTSLKIVDLGDSITEIGIYAFRECSSLAAVIINKSIPPAIVYIGDSSNASSYTLDLVFGNSSVNIYVPDAAVDTYKSTAPYSNFASNIKPLSTYNESTVLSSQN